MSKKNKHKSEPKPITPKDPPKVVDDSDLLGGDTQESPSDPTFSEDGIQIGIDGDMDESKDSGKGDLGNKPPMSAEIKTIGEVDLENVSTSPQETPFLDDKVARSQGLNVPWKGADAVVTDKTIIGKHPATGEPIRVCDQ